MVDDESKPERRPTKHSPPPAEWSSKHNAAYSYYAYYLAANLRALNELREARGLNTFAFRCAGSCGVGVCCGVLFWRVVCVWGGARGLFSGGRRQPSASPPLAPDPNR